MVFRRRRETDDPSDEITQGDLEDGTDASADAEVEAGPPGVDASPAASTPEPYAVAVPARPNGPWDSADVPKDDETARIDLGGIHLPVPDGIEVRVEVQDDVPMAATLVDGNTALQVHAFAAPKSSGLWAEVRKEISQSLQSSGGSAEPATGPFGAELKARIPVEGGPVQPARFLGVDGPRWFLRGLLTGDGATNLSQARRLEDAFRQIVVHRGSDAMAPRDMLPLHLPRDAIDAVPAATGDEPDRSLQLPERGPEITEIQ
jgi:hypothetical protein